MLFQKKVENNMGSSFKGCSWQHGAKLNQKRRLFHCFAPFQSEGFEHPDTICKTAPDFQKAVSGHRKKLEKTNKSDTILRKSAAMFTERAHEQKINKMTFLQPRWSQHKPPRRTPKSGFSNWFWTIFASQLELDFWPLWKWRHLRQDAENDAENWATPAEHCRGCA